MGTFPTLLKIKLQKGGFAAMQFPKKCFSEGFLTGIVPWKTFNIHVIFPLDIRFFKMEMIIQIIKCSLH